MKSKEPSPTDDELVRSLDVLFRSAHESALFVYWKIIDRSITAHFEISGTPNAKELLGNGLLQASLLLIRKSTEFFKPKEAHDEPDTLYAYRYLPLWQGTWIVDKNITYRELHKHIGHITIREVRCGRQVWPIADFSAQVIEHWIRFFTDVRESAIFKGNPPTQQLDSYVLSLQEVLRGCHALARKQTKQRR